MNIFHKMVGKTKKTSAISELSTKIILLSISCNQSLERFLEQDSFYKIDKKDSIEYITKNTFVLFEFTYFFMHIANRIIYSTFDRENAKEVQSKLGPLIVDTIIDKICEGWSQKHIIGVKNDFYRNLNISEEQYSECKKVFLPLEKDTDTFQKLNGEKSKSLVGQLIDNLSEILSGSFNMDICLTTKVTEMIMEILDREEIRNLIQRIKLEI